MTERLPGARDYMHGDTEEQEAEIIKALEETGGMWLCSLT